MSILKLLAVHDLERLIRSKRLWLIGGLFVGAAVLLGGGVVLMLNAVENALMSELGASTGAALTPEMRDEIIRQLGQEVDTRWQRAGALQRSLLGTSAFALAMFALPGLVVVSFSDSLARDRRNRSWRFDTLRASRAELLGVRVTTTTLLVIALVGLACATVLLPAAMFLETQSLSGALHALAAILLRIAPAAFVIVAWVFTASASTPSATAALIRAVLLLAALTLGIELLALILMSAAELDQDGFIIRALHALQPGRHAVQLASSDTVEAARGALALIAHGAAGCAATYAIVKRSDA